VAHLARRGERPSVIPVAPDAPSAAEGAVERPRHADGEPPEAAAERPRVVGLDDEMEMVVLHTEMEDPKALVGGRTERTEDGREDPAGSQAADGTPAAQGDMHRVRGGVRGPRAVRDAGTAARGELSAGAGAASTPGAWRREAKLQGARHLD